MSSVTCGFLVLLLEESFTSNCEVGGPVVFLQRKSNNTIHVTIEEKIGAYVLHL